MEIMERLVQIRTLFVIVFTFFIISNISAQHQIDKDVTFSYKGKNSYARLNSFLGNYKFDMKDLGNCMTASGIIRFQITPKGKIASINTDGNLPNVLIEAVKERIYLTENSWVFSKSALKKNKNIEFYYPIYLSIDLEDKCDIPIHESQILLKILFENEKVLHVKDEIYYLAPDFWSSER